MIPLNVNNFQSTLFNNLFNIAIPPAAISCSVCGSQLVEDAVHPMVIGTTVLEKKDSAMFGLGDAAKMLQHAYRIRR